MKEQFKNGISIKVVSLLLAMLFWLAVMNIDNPYGPTKIEVPIKILNKDTLEEKGLYLKNESELLKTVQITISGRKEVTQSINPSNFIVELDLAKIDSELDKAIDIESPILINSKDVRIVRWTPHSVKIDLEKILNNTFTVDIERKGELKPGYKITRMTFSPETVALQGLESLITTVGSIKAVLDVNGLDRDLDKKIPCKVYNKAGKEIVSLSKNLAVEVKVEVGKEVPITVATKGKPSEDFVEVARTVSPQKVVIRGTAEAMAHLTELKTEPIDLSNMNKSFSGTGVIKLPDGIRLVDSPKEVTVNIEIEQLIQKDYAIAQRDIAVNAPADSVFGYEVKTESVNIQLKGRQEDIQGINLGSLKPNIDVAGLGEGTHRIPLNISLPAEVKLIQGAEIEVKVNPPAAQ